MQNEPLYSGHTVCSGQRVWHGLLFNTNYSSRAVYLPKAVNGPDLWSQYAFYLRRANTSNSVIAASKLDCSVSVGLTSPYWNKIPEVSPKSS